MKKTLLLISALALGNAALAKLPAPSEEAKAKAAEAAKPAGDAKAEPTKAPAAAPAATTAPSAEPTKAPAAPTAAPAKVLKVGLVTDVGKVDDKSFNESAWNGAKKGAADVKGDLSGIAMPGDSKPPFVQRAKDIGVAYTPDRFPIVFWDVFGEQGHPVRATVSEMGPLLLSRMLDLNDVQEGVLNVAFRVAELMRGA